jgi:hypothetical protein
MANDKLDETACRGLPVLPLRVRSLFVGRTRHPLRAVARHSSFGLAFYIPNGRESHDGLADSRQFRRGDHFIDILVSGPGFLSEPCP